MAVLTSKVEVTNYLDVKSEEPINPVEGQNWRDGKILKVFKDGKWISEDLTGPPGENGEKGDKGDSGETGKPGENGVGIKSTLIEYRQSIDGNTPPTTGWSETVPAPVKGIFLWTRTTTTYTDSNETTALNTSYYGADGEPGKPGKPTGIITSSSAPPATERYEGMLWKDTANGILKKWVGNEWIIETLGAANIWAENLSAITANLGTVKAGHISGTDIVSIFNDVIIAGFGENTLKNPKASGTATMSIGKLRVEFAITDPDGVAEYRNSYGYFEFGVNGLKSGWYDAQGNMLAYTSFGVGAYISSYSRIGGEILGGDLTPSDLRSVPKTQIQAATGFLPYDTTGVNLPTVKRAIGKNITLAGAFKNINAIPAGSSVVIGILPRWAWPADQVNWGRPQASGMNGYNLVIRTNGELVLSRYGIATEINVVVGSWLNVSSTFAAAV